MTHQSPAPIDPIDPIDPTTIAPRSLEEISILFWRAKQDYTLATASLADIQRELDELVDSRYPVTPQRFDEIDAIIQRRNRLKEKAGALVARQKRAYIRLRFLESTPTPDQALAYMPPRHACTPPFFSKEFREVWWLEGVDLAYKFLDEVWAANSGGRGETTASWWSPSWPPGGESVTEKAAMNGLIRWSYNCLQKLHNSDRVGRVLHD